MAVDVRQRGGAGIGALGAATGWASPGKATRSHPQRQIGVFGGVAGTDVRRIGTPLGSALPGADALAGALTAKLPSGLVSTTPCSSSTIDEPIATPSVSTEWVHHVSDLCAAF